MARFWGGDIVGKYALTNMEHLGMTFSNLFVRWFIFEVQTYGLF